MITQITEWNNIKGPFYDQKAYTLLNICKDRTR